MSTFLSFLPFIFSFLFFVPSLPLLNQILLTFLVFFFPSFCQAFLFSKGDLNSSLLKTQKKRQLFYFLLLPVAKHMKQPSLLSLFRMAHKRRKPTQSSRDPLCKWRQLAFSFNSPSPSCGSKIWTNPPHELTSVRLLPCKPITKQTLPLYYTCLSTWAWLSCITMSKQTNFLCSQCMDTNMYILMHAKKQTHQVCHT